MGRVKTSRQLAKIWSSSDKMERKKIPYKRHYKAFAAVLVCLIQTIIKIVV